MANIYADLLHLQQNVRVKKSNFNNFGNFSYRSAEDILEAVKPFLKERELVLLMSDTVEEYGGEKYVAATATLINQEGGHIEATAYAREAKERPKFDASQLTGSASSYARKYALNGLLCLYDSQDPDQIEEHEEKRKEVGERIQAYIKAKNLNWGVVEEEAKALTKAKDFKSMTTGQMIQTYNHLLEKYGN